MKALVSVCLLLTLTSAWAANSARPNTLAGHPACKGYTVENYEEYFERDISDYSAEKLQLDLLCVVAYNHYAMYLGEIDLGEIDLGESQADNDLIYATFQDAALAAMDFYAKTQK